MAALAKHAEITALVQQLKEGRLSKEELFARLQALQKGVAVTGAPSTDAAVPSAAAAIAQPAMPPPAPVSHTAAAAAARDGSAPSSPLEPADDDGDGHFGASYPSAAATAAPAAAAVNGSMPSHAGMYNGAAASSSASAAPPPPAAVQAPRLPVHRQGVAPPPAPSAAPGTGSGAGGAAADARLQRPPSAAAGQRRPSLSGGQAPGTSAGSGAGADASGASGSAVGPGGQVYTFTPRRTPLPASYGPTAHRVLSSVPFQGESSPPGLLSATAAILLCCPPLLLELITRNRSPHRFHPFLALQHAQRHGSGTRRSSAPPWLPQPSPGSWRSAPLPPPSTQRRSA